MDKLKIRRYEAKDNPVVWDLHWLGLTQNGVERTDEVHPWHRDFDNIEEVYFKDGDFIVGEINGQVVASGAFKKVDKEIAEIKRMRVHPDFQHKGFGQEILEELEKRAREKGFKKMKLDTGRKWTSARKFYEKNGYKEAGKHLFSNGYDAILYEKYLS